MNLKHTGELARGMQEPEKKPPNDFIQDRNTRVLLNKFLSGEIETLEPVFNPKTGYRYSNAEAIVGDSSEVTTFLNQLVQEKILERKLIDKVVYCPACNSANLTFRYCCPFCKSFNIQKSSLIEHIKCGYMDLEENFRRGPKLVCPKCGEEMERMDVDYTKAGVWCSCRDCKKSFNIPVPEHYCRDCHATSDFEQAPIRLHLEPSG